MAEQGEGRIYVDGTAFSPREAKVSVLDHGYLYGDGVFETFRTYGGRPFRLNEHLDRLEKGLEATAIGGAPSKRQLAEQVDAALRDARLEEAYCRITVTRGVGVGGLDPRSCSNPTCIVAALPLRFFPQSFYDEGIRSILLWARTRDDRPPPSVKSTSYQRTVLARLELARRNANEGFFLDENRCIAEGSTSNVFAVFGDTIVTPPDDICLRGITRDEVLALARAEGFTVREEPLPVARLSSADEIFITSSLAELIPVTHLEEARVGTGLPGPVQRRLLERYRVQAREAT